MKTRSANGRESMRRMNACAWISTIKVIDWCVKCVCMGYTGLDNDVDNDHEKEDDTATNILCAAAAYNQ